ncbi:MAG: T9SS type A sorting domain-containing protein [Bacteroidia bacterium]|nr:T9SS type A sorting domain-containing protein [Bacteroidia bacterium]
MKTLLYGSLFLLLFFLNTLLNAQSFGIDGSYWRYCSPIPIQSPSYLQLSGRDTINNIPVFSISGSTYAQLGATNTTRWFHVSGDSTFVYDPADSSLSLLYNFSAQLGDFFHFDARNSLLATHTSPPPPYYMRYKVTSTGVTSLSSSGPLRFYEMEPDSSSPGLEGYVNPYYFSLRVVEKIGIINFAPSAIMPVYTAFAWEGGSPGLFYYTNSQHPDLYGDSAGVCIQSLEEAELSSLRIYPNPSSGFVMVESSAELLQGVVLYDLSGRMLSRVISQPATVLRLDMQPYVPGVYILEVQSQSGHSQRQKIIRP